MKQIATVPNTTYSNDGDDRSSAVIYSPDFTWYSGSNAIMRRLNEEITHVDNTDNSIVIAGESGNVKTTVPRIIHERSRRVSARLVDINCAALPANLIESELFGFERGAFTGATARKKGLFEVADKGTLFLDTIGDLKP